MKKLLAQKSQTLSFNQIVKVKGGNGGGGDGQEPPQARAAVTFIKLFKN
jgi:hypothetical protein